MTKAATGIGQSTHVSRGSWETASSSTARLTAQKPATCATVSRPEGISRAAVRGLRASMSASIRRLSAIARLRAPIIAIVIHHSTAARGTSMRAMTAAAKANGRAKIVCEKRTRPSSAGTSPSPAAGAAALDEVVTAAMLPTRAPLRGAEAPGRRFRARRRMDRWGPAAASGTWLTGARRPSAPENTLPAFELAIVQRADVVECDVRATSDGALLLLHDATVDRTTSGTGELRAMTAAQARELDAGEGERIPELGDVLALAAGRVRVNVDLKEADIVDDAVAVVRAAGAEGSVTYISFLPEVWQRLDELAPGSPMIHLVDSAASLASLAMGDAGSRASPRASACPSRSSTRGWSTGCTATATACSPGPWTTRTRCAA